MTAAFYNAIMAQTTNSANITDSIDMNMFGLAMECSKRGMDKYQTTGVLASKLFDIAASSLHPQQVVVINFVELAKKWMKWM